LAKYFLIDSLVLQKVAICNAVTKERGAVLQIFHALL
jgi:hypothetical protein